MRNTSTGRFESRDFTGFRSGKVTAIRPTGEHDKWGYALWDMACDCGNIFVRPCQILTAVNPIQSCGCGPRGRTPKQSHHDALFKKHRQNAISRGLSFDLDVETHRRIIISPCAYCGAEPIERPHPYMKARITSNSIDRIDSGKGYTIDNCVPACVTCNTAKMSMPVGHFREWVARVYAHMYA